MDSHGRVHVIFYDNRHDECTTQPNEPYKDKYDVYYALSAHDQETGEITGFTNYNLTDCATQERPLDPTFEGSLTTWSPREYNGLAIYDVGDVTYVWVVYTGTSSDDQPTDPNAVSWDKSHTVIYAQRIKILN